MAERTPLVLIDGSLSEIPVSDTLDTTVKNAELLDGMDSSNFALTSHSHNLASLIEHGFMAKEDKYKLENIEEFSDKTDYENVRDAGALMGSSFNTKGDLLVGLSDNTYEVLSRGHEGYILTSTDSSPTGLSWMYKSFIVNWGDIQGDINNQQDLLGELNTRYKKTDHINSSNGVTDAGKPIVLNAQGHVDSTMLKITAFHYVGNHTPTDGTSEYPDPTNETDGAFWVIQGLSDPYTFEFGDLRGTTVNNGAYMVWSDSTWSVIHSSVDPSIYYKLDGTQAITNPFASGGQQFKNAAEGTDATDLVTLSQLNQYSPTIHTHEPSAIIPQGHLSTLNADTVDGVHSDQLFKVTGGDILGDVTIQGNFQVNLPSKFLDQGIFDKDIIIGLDALNNSSILFKDSVGGYNSIFFDNSNKELMLKLDNVSGKVWTELNLVPTDFSPIQHSHNPIDINPQGTGSGLDADTLDGKHADEIQMNDQDILEALKRVDGHLSGVDADLLDGFHATEFAKTNHNHEIIQINSLEQELLNRFTKSEFISSSQGSADVGKPIVLNNKGQIDSSMLEISTFYYVDIFTPSSSLEYPDPTNESSGAFWLVSNLTSDYTFTTGDLTGETTKNGDLMLWSSNGWGLMETSLDPNLYYKLDGSQAITNDFNAGNYKLSNVKAGENDLDAVNYTQLNTKSNISHLHDPSDITPQGHLSNLDADMLDGKHSSSFSPITHSHFISDITDLQDELDLKENYLGIPQTNGEVLISDISGVRSWISFPDTEVIWGDINGVLSNQTDLQAVLDSKPDLVHSHNISDVLDLSDELDTRYKKTDHINNSNGVTDAGKPIVLNAQGQIDSSMLDLSTLYYVGPFTPSSSLEYPDPSGETYGAYWVIQGLSPSYTFTTGDLIGEEAFNNNQMIWSSSGWSLLEGTLDSRLFYKLDGTQAITNPFAGGGQQFKNASAGTDEEDLVILAQLNNHTHIEANITDLDKYKQSEVNDLLDTKEDYLNSPTNDGQILSSLVNGTRSWIDLPSGGTTNWGDIEGTLSNQTDLQDALDAKVGKSGDTMTGNLIFTVAGGAIQLTNSDTNYIQGNDSVGANGWIFGRADSGSDNVKLSNYHGSTLTLLSGGGVVIDNDQIWHEGNFDPITKENNLGNPANDGEVLSSTASGTRSWIPMSGGSGDVNWGDIEGTLSNQTDLQDALDDKSGINHNHDGDYEEFLGIPLEDGQVLSSTTAGSRIWIPMSGDVNWGDIEGTLSNQADLQDALDDKAHRATVSYSPPSGGVDGDVWYEV